ncbi:MAG: DUF4411 family protein [Spirochaetaceae bacterium]|jgi:hypothetical protein|nr:DUF4411 family protein [Spirochaetaceae bacterium]
MKYIFDNNTLTGIFRHYYRDSFPSFWSRFDNMAAEGSIFSVREVHNEIKNYDRKDDLAFWAKANPNFFHDPTPEELQFINQIYSVPHFTNNMSQKKLLLGGPFADPFIIAKAHVEHGTVVTQEQYKLNAARIPNICEHFHIPCINLQMFLKQNDWNF